MQDRYDNFIGGDGSPPKDGEYRENLTPATGEPFCEVAVLDSGGHRARARRGSRRQGRLGETSPTERAGC